jgi:transglutaminase-like putative cysteine protease
MKTTQTMKFVGDGIELSSVQFGAQEVQKLPLPQQAWMPPAAGSRYMKAELAKGNKEIVVWTMSAATGPQPMETRTKILGRENIEVMGKVVPALACEVKTSVSPMVAKDYVNEQGESLKATLPIMPGMTMTLLAADKEIATAPVKPAELMVRLLLTPDRAIKQPRQLQRAVYELRFKDGQKVELPLTSTQTVTWAGDTARVTVDAKAARREELKSSQEYERSSMMLGSDDPEVIRLAKESLVGVANTPATEAEAMRKYVGNYIEEKSLAVGLASAGEVARLKQGDCTEHAVLLAAMLRWDGIPSRTASGIVYAEQFAGRSGVFGYHMWTQAWIDQRWVELDATLPEAFDATHVAMSVSSMNDAAVTNDLIAMSTLIGRFEIKVVEP